MNAQTLHQISKKTPVARQFLIPALPLLALAGSCAPAGKDAPASPPAIMAAPQCDEPGSLKTAVFGSIQAEIDWSATEMACQSMPRPRGDGIRLRFAGDVAGETLAIIIAIPELAAGTTALESPSNVTVTVEDSGRFFSTPDLNTCWTDIESATPVAEVAGMFLLSGTLYCVSALGEVNGVAAISIPELSFTAHAGWGE